MNNKDKKPVSFEDFELDNILNPVEPIKDAQPAPENDAPEEEELQNPVNVPEEDSGPEVEPENPGVTEAPDETPEIDLTPFYQVFHEKLGWEVPEDKMPENSVEGLINYLNEIVEHSSRPQYSSEEAANFDRFLANGGKAEDFFKTMYGSKDYENFTATTDDDKKGVLKDYIKRLNPEKDNDWIERKITRYEESGVLDDEFEDAISELRSISAREKQELVANQEKQRLQEKQEYEAQVQRLEQTILNKRDIAGIPISKDVAKDFFKFLTAVEKDGTTKYQKVVAADEEAAIKMAFIAYNNFDVNKLKTSVKSDVVKDLKKALGKFSSSNGIQSRTAVPQKSTNIDYKEFDLGI